MCLPGKAVSQRPSPLWTEGRGPAAEPGRQMPPDHPWRASRLRSSPSVGEPGAERAEADVLALLDEAEAALRAGDWPRYAAVWAHERWIELLHPAEGEWLTGWDRIGPGYRSLLTSGMRLHIERRQLSVRVAPAGEMAWAVAETVVHGADHEVPATLWITYVLERRGGRWQLVHGHVSAPAPAARDDLWRRGA